MSKPNKENYNLSYIIFLLSQVIQTENDKFVQKCFFFVLCVCTEVGILSSLAFGLAVERGVFFSTTNIYQRASAKNLAPRGTIRVLIPLLIVVERLLSYGLSPPVILSVAFLRLTRVMVHA